MKRLLALFLTLALALSALSLPVSAVDAVTAEGSAELLYHLGLFRGTGVNPDGSPVFNLGRAPTRAEGVTMLVRLLGKEDDALRAVQAQPFIDVPTWARPYVSFAYRQGYTKGVSADRFGASDSITAAQYLTFLLRALGYEDGTDFTWRTPWTLTDKLGITNGEYDSKSVFLRGDAAAVSANALTAQRKDSDQNMLEYLVSSGVITDKSLVIWGYTTLKTQNGFTSVLFYPIKGSPASFSSFKVDKVTVNGQRCQTLQLTNEHDVAAYLASIGVSSGGFGYIEVTFDQEDALKNAKETYTDKNGRQQPWLIFEFSCTGTRADGLSVLEYFSMYQEPVS